MKNQYTIIPLILIAFLIFTITSSTKAQSNEVEKTHQVIVETIETNGSEAQTDSVIKQIIQIVNSGTIINTIHKDSIPNIFLGTSVNGSTHEYITEFDYQMSMNDLITNVLTDIQDNSLLNHEIIVVSTKEDDPKIKTLILEKSDLNNELIIISDDGENIIIERDGEIIFINKEKQIEKINSNMEILEETNGKNVIIVQTKITLDELNNNDTKSLKSSGIETSSKTPEFDYVKFYADQSENKINIKFKLADRGNITVKVVDMLGRNIFYETRTNFEGEYNQSIDLNSHSKGTYIMQIAQENRSITRKIMVE